jgi:hypothetical protein
MLRKIHGTNFFHIQFLGPTHIKCQNGPVLPPALVFNSNGQAFLVNCGRLNKITEMRKLPLRGKAWYVPYS